MPVDPAWVALSLLRQVGMRTMSALLDHFGTAQAVLQAEAAELYRIAGIGPRTVEAIHGIRPDAVGRALLRWQEAGVQVLSFYDVAYPQALRDLPDAPPTLFVRGQWPLEQNLPEQAVALVGTRRPSPAVRAAALTLGRQLTRQGWLVVSGLALGIDTAAHTGALSAGEGVSLAVLGGGVLNVYPAANRALAGRLMRSGAILSETAPEDSANAPRLVARNRLISGLSRALIVMETDINGGAMHAARFARSQGRAVAALDIPASGNRQLIAEGAMPIGPQDLSTLDPAQLV